MKIGSKDKRMWAVGGNADSNFYVFDLEEKKMVTKVRNHKKGIKCLVMTGDDEFAITAGNDATIRIWDNKLRCEVAMLQGHTDSVNAICMTKDDKFIISGSSDLTVRIWDFGTRQLIG